MSESFEGAQAKTKITAAADAFAVDAVMGAGIASADKNNLPQAKKYELVASDVEGLYRIKALRDVGPSVKAGDIGGYVSGEHNLSHNGEAWVACNARVFGDARVLEDAQVLDNAQVFDSALVFGKARVFDAARVSGGAYVFEDARVSGGAHVFENSVVRGDAQVFGDARVLGNAWVVTGAVDRGSFDGRENNAARRIPGMNP